MTNLVRNSHCSFSAAKPAFSIIRFVLILESDVYICQNEVIGSSLDCFDFSGWIWIQEVKSRVYDLMHFGEYDIFRFVKYFGLFDPLPN